MPIKIVNKINTPLPTHCVCEVFGHLSVDTQDDVPGAESSPALCGRADGEDVPHANDTSYGIRMPVLASDYTKS